MRLLGYIFSALGIIVLILSFNLTRINIPLLSTISSTYLIAAGLILIVLGIILLMSKQKTKAKQEKEEVPIYRGNKIVGYRKEK